jgi:hypothetical protein
MCQVSGRVIIDAYGLNKHNNDYHYASKPLEPDDQDEQEGGDARNFPQNGFKDDSPRLPHITVLDRRPSKEEQAQNREFLLHHPQFLLIMSPKLPGFSLKMNKWCKSIAVTATRLLRLSQSTFILTDFATSNGIQLHWRALSCQRTTKVFF